MAWRGLDAAEKRKRFSSCRTQNIDLDDGCRPTDIDLEEFLQLKQKQKETVNREITEHCNNRIKNKIGATLWNKTCRQLSLVLSLVPGDSKENTAERDLEKVFNEQEDCLFDRVKNVIEEYKGLFEEAFLLLNVSKTGRYSYDVEKAARDHQLVNYYNAYLNGKETERYPAMHVEIKKYAEIGTNTRHFMKYIAARAKLATIVLNGHGTSSGEIVLEDDSKHLSSEFLKDVHKIWKELHTEEVADKDKVVLPAKVTVVFAQCYGHKYEQDPEHKDAIEVVSLSKDSTPETAYTIMRCGESVIDSVHEELNEYANQNRTGTAPEQSPADCPTGLGAEASHVTPDERLRCELFVPSLFATIGLNHSYSSNFNIMLKEISARWRKYNREAPKTSCHIVQSGLNLLTLNETRDTEQTPVK